MGAIALGKKEDGKRSRRPLANQATWRVMCAAAGRQKEDWLRVEDVERFPCKDLRTIDQLWVKYSKGRFGFSVQKQIWQECGRPKNYRKQRELESPPLKQVG